MTRPIATLRNLGPVMARALAAIDVHDEADLRALGAVEAYLRLRPMTARMSLVALYAMHAALMDCDWRALPAETKAALREAVTRVTAGRRARS